MSYLGVIFHCKISVSITVTKRKKLIAVIYKIIWHYTGIKANFKAPQNMYFVYMHSEVY